MLPVSDEPAWTWGRLPCADARAGRVGHATDPPLAGWNLKALRNVQRTRQCVAAVSTAVIDDLSGEHRDRNRQVVCSDCNIRGHGGVDVVQDVDIAEAHVDKTALVGVVSARVRRRRWRTVLRLYDRQRHGLTATAELTVVRDDLMCKHRDWDSDVADSRRDVGSDGEV